MINRSYAGANPANNRESIEGGHIRNPSSGNANPGRAHMTFASSPNANLATVQSAVATLLGDSEQRRDNQREMLINLVRQEQLENDDASFESDNQWLSRSEQSSPSSASPSAAQMRYHRSPEEEHAVLPRTGYFNEPTPIMQELRELRARNQDLGAAAMAGNGGARRNETEAQAAIYGSSRPLFYGNQTSTQQEVRQ